MKSTTLGILLSLGSLSLGAQTAMLRVHMDRNVETPEAPASLVVLDAAGPRTLYDGFTTLLQQEALRAFQVPLRAYTLGSGSEKDLLAQHHLNARAQWLLLDRHAKILARGEGVPEAEAFAQHLLGAGFRDLVRELRTYLKSYPEMQEAREQLIAQLRERAERTALRFMGIQLPTKRDRLERGDYLGYQQEMLDPAKADLGSARPLDPVQDLDAWGAFAQELDVVFRSGQWREMNFVWLREGRGLDGASPTLRAVYQRWLPSVEAALQQQPESEPCWDLWLWMNEAVGGTRLKALLASLEPTPLTPREQWPPDRAVRALLRSARTPADWRALKELFQARWEGVPHTLQEAAPFSVSVGSGSGSEAAPLDQDWITSLEPLLESCLRAGDTAQADALFIDVFSHSQWKALPARGAALARRCGQGALAERWAALRPAR